MSAKTIVAMVIAAASVVALIVWFALSPQRVGKNSTSPSSLSLGAGSSIASPFATSAGPSAPPESIMAQRPSPERQLGVARRTPVALGAKAWQFEPLQLGSASAGTLYARIAQGPIDASNVDTVALFAETMSRCWSRDLRKKIQATRAERSKALHNAEAIQREAGPTVVDTEETMCADAPADAVAKSDQWLSEAADRGNARAQFMYASGLQLSWLTDPKVVYRNPERLVEYKSKASEYLNALVADGHYDSLRHLSVLHTTPLLNEDPALAWAYAMAAFKAKNDQAAEGNLLRRLETMQPADRVRAQSEADRIFNRCCR